jgi:hypothetical protein
MKYWYTWKIFKALCHVYYLKAVSEQKNYSCKSSIKFLKDIPGYLTIENIVKWL